MKLEVYPRKDGKWAWRVRASNGQIVATDGGQGYNNKQDAINMADRILDEHAVPATTTFSVTPDDAF